MARMRTVHPEQYTDEDFVELSIYARMLVIAIRNFADDYGIFEWKPKKIKMQIFPVDNINVEELMEEIETVGLICEFRYDGRNYGCIRNFLKYQSPQRPTSKYPKPTCFGSDAEMMRYMAGDSDKEIPAVWLKYSDSNTGGVPEESERDTGEITEEHDTVQDGKGKGKGKGKGEGKDIILLCQNQGDSDEGAPVGEIDHEGEKPEEPDIVKSKQTDYKQVLKLFHELCPKMPKVQKLTDKRKTHIRARLKDYGMVGLKDIFTKAGESKFLNGGSGWTAGFDWILESRNAVKILEGNYSKDNATMQKMDSFNDSLNKFKQLGGGAK